MFKKFFSKQLTIRDLIDIDDSRIDRSKKLKVKLVKIYDIVKEETWFDKFINFFKNKPKLIYYKLFRFAVDSDSGKQYTVFIKVSPSFDVNKFLSNKVQVFCSCPDFKYRATYELNRQGNVYLNKSLKEHLGIALTTAPTKVVTTTICKHLYAVLLEFKLNIRRYGLIKVK